MSCDIPNLSCGTNVIETFIRSKDNSNKSNELNNIINKQTVEKEEKLNCYENKNVDSASSYIESSDIYNNTNRASPYNIKENFLAKPEKIENQDLTYLPNLGSVGSIFGFY